MLPTSPVNIQQNVKIAVRDYINESLREFSFCFTLSVPEMKDIGKPKAWLTDSVLSETYSRFRSSNCVLGNRYATKSGFFSKVCLFCSEKGILALNNEVHLVIECQHFTPVRQQCIIGKIVSELRTWSPCPDSVFMYKFILDDQKLFRHQVMKGLHSILSAWQHDITRFN